MILLVVAMKIRCDLGRFMVEYVLQDSIFRKERQCVIVVTYRPCNRITYAEKELRFANQVLNLLEGGLNIQEDWMSIKNIFL